MLQLLDDPGLLRHFNEVVAFANKMGLLGQLIGQLHYLDTYSHHPQTPERTTRCELMQDFAPHSFRFIMYRREMTPEGLKEEFWFNGGLIYQGPESPSGGAFPSLSVSLADGVGWFVNT